MFFLNLNRCPLVKTLNNWVTIIACLLYPELLINYIFLVFLHFFIVVSHTCRMRFFTSPAL